ncbi:MAG: DNA-cytosine methyltransferase (EC [uncultured Sulfurovum sp.]|uniref:Cytosine-specific methyltransferase n=1 Tax=uncultured Sulfurovum sp. TaxID=269237 RepID=A0A6S6TKC3_9BACT|nr:MAG: DNA-cytosine methyltransferase (EC [uncultured Sulfurovum sp.]
MATLNSTFRQLDMTVQLNDVDKKKSKQTCKIIDIFAGMGGMHLGLEQAFKKYGIETECVMTSEIKASAIDALNHNFEHQLFYGDISKVEVKDIPNFDFLLGGFPCQAFSSAGNRDGFCDTRGTLFFEIERILKAKRPQGFILENVEGLVTHDKGKTLEVILKSLDNLGYNVDWKVLDSKDFLLPQSRKRIYIVGSLESKIDLNNIEKLGSKVFEKIQEKGLKTIDSLFTKKLLSHLPIDALYGKAIKDKRGGVNNIHSWDFGLKGEVSETQKQFLRQLFKERRKKHWAQKIGIEWMDGMPLTLEQIESFFDVEDLENLLDDLVEKGYLRFEHPKEKIKINSNGSIITRREYATEKPKGYNIVTGKLSFEFSKILDPKGLAPTLVAADVEKLGVVDGQGIRKISLREGLRLFGYPETYSLEIFEGNVSKKRKAFDLLGNTVAVPVIEEVATLLAKAYVKKVSVAS